MIAKEVYLTVYIGGAHFSCCLFDIKSKRLRTETYRSIPISYKVPVNYLLAFWQQEILAISEISDVRLVKCMIAAPAALIPSVNNEPNERYLIFQQIDLSLFFAGTLNVAEASVQMIYSAEAFLKGHLFLNPASAGQKHIGIYIGTDFTAVEISAGSPVRLGWEGASFLDRRANDYLSAHSLLRQYFRATGISLLNVSQLGELYNDHPSAKNILKDFTTNLTLFLSKQAVLEKNVIIVLGGDLISCCQPVQRALTLALAPAELLVSQGKEVILLGAALSL